MNAVDLTGVTPLMQAAQNGHVLGVELLVFQGADVNQTEDSGNTALILAAKNGHYDCIKLLFEAGASVNVVNDLRASARTEAEFYGHKKCASLLRECENATKRRESRDSRMNTANASYENIDVVD